MTDSAQRATPGGWPWAKKQGESTKESDAPINTQDKGVQEPELAKTQSENPIELKDDAAENVGSTKDDIVRKTGSVKNSVSQKKDPELMTNGETNQTNGDIPEEVQSRINGSKDLPEDEGKDMTEPDQLPQTQDVTDQAQQNVQDTTDDAQDKAEDVKDQTGDLQDKAGDVPDDVQDKTEDVQGDLQDKTEDVQDQAQTQPEDQKSQSGFSNIASGVKNLVPTSLPGSKASQADDTSQQGEVPEELKKLQEEIGDQDTLTMPKEAEDAQKSAEATTDDIKEVEPEPISEETDKKPEDLTEEAQKTVEDAEKKPADLTDEAQNTAEDVPEDAEKKVGDLSEDAPKTDDLPEDAKDKVGDLPEDAPKTDELPEDAKDKVDDTTEEAGDKLGETTEEAGDKVDEAAETAEEAAPEIDFSILKGCKVNKGGNVVNDKGEAIGRITSGILAHLIGRKVDENGDIWNDNGKQIGKAEPIPENELQDSADGKPFESFEGNSIDSKGFVIWNGEQIGKVTEGDLKVLRGKTVDPDGEVLDKSGNVIGKAERWEPEPEAEPEPEVEVDRSILAGKRVNKAGNVVDTNGTIFGRVVEGDPKSMIGRMCNKKGEILSESGDVIGKAEIVPEGEREGLKEGPFAELSGLTVTKDGKVVTPGGDVVGRVIKGDPKILAGRAVDEDGDILDRNGNSLGKAERWEEPEVEKTKGPMAGLHVNREGNVVDNQGNLIGKLTSGDVNICAGKEIDDDGDVINSKGQTVGHVNLISDIPEPEPEGESEEDKKKREDLERDKKLATQMSVCLEQCLDKIKPICKMITTKIEKAERTPEDERDEDALVKEVRPLIEEGGKILQEAHGIIKGLDPDGRIQANAKHKSATREATSEEFHLADVIKELTGSVTECIENAKRKLEDMPHAKKELSPLWGLLGEPLFQIIAAVGLLLNGVLGIVGRLLSGLGLGGIVDGLLGTLGIKNILDALGVGSLTDALFPKKKGGKK